uniref:Uncharacterized protein n=1 Tax=viral metagenome TaxID=1070528 RepID=A0A6M3IZ87_9ZZZZ
MRHNEAKSFEELKNRMLSLEDIVLKYQESNTEKIDKLATELAIISKDVIIVKESTDAVTK